MTRCLVDTSAWVDFLGGERSAVERVGELVAEGAAVICGPIVAELLSGARASGEFARLKDLAGALETLPDPEDAWNRVADYRYALARGGFLVGLVDLLIAATALDAGLTLLTRDRDFERIRTVVPIELDLF